MFTTIIKVFQDLLDIIYNNKLLTIKIRTCGIYRYINEIQFCSLYVP